MLLSPCITSGPCTKEPAKSFGHQSHVFPRSAKANSGHTEGISLTSLSRAEVKGGWKWITSLAWWFIRTFPWHQVLSYALPLFFLYFALWLMLENSPTRKVIKWLPARKGGCWGLQASMPDAQGNNLGCLDAEFYNYCSRMCYDFCFSCTVYTRCDMFLFIGADLPTLLYCWPAFISSLTLLTLASIWQLNTLHHSAAFALRTDVELITDFLFPFLEVTGNCPSLNPERFFYR